MSNQFALTKEQFLDLFHEMGDTGILDGADYGKEDGDDFLIVESPEQLRALQCIINGYKGDTFLESVWRDQEISVEIDKADAELVASKLKSPDHLGTHSRLEKRIKGLHNLVVYKRWLFENEIEEIDFNDIDLEVGFSDEYSKCVGGCNGCNEVVRTSPDSYHWTAPLFIDCEGYACDDCAVNKYSDEMLETHKNEQKSIPECFNTKDLGLVKINDHKLENGMYNGMDDSPEPIIEKLNEQDIDVWFVVHPSQFHLSFDVYVKDEDEQKARDVFDGTNTYQGFSTAGNLERGLKEASKQMSELKGDGIKYSTVNSDGTATSRLVSNEEFIDGIKK